MNQNRGGIVLAGFAGDRHVSRRWSMPIIVATRSLIWPTPRRSHALDEMPGYEVHRAVTKVSGLYGDVYEKRTIGSPQLYLASSAGKKTSASDTDKRLRSVIASLEECQVFLADGASRDAAQLLAMAALQLRMRLHRIADAELKALCDAMTVDAGANPDLPEASNCR